MKAILILSDGMRPDAVLSCGHPFVSRFLDVSAHALDAQTVFPSVTLPCHMSLFHSVKPDRHGVLTNTYTPQVRPVEGLFERLDRFEKRGSLYYTWEELRDLERPGHLTESRYLNQHFLDNCDKAITEAALQGIQAYSPDFTFLYLGWVDSAGHNFGWMSPEYMQAVSIAWDCIQRVYESLTGDTALLVTADHGGHDRSHGTTLPEDMTIPLFLYGKPFAPGQVLTDASILDIAPTVAALTGITPSPDWEGKSLL